MAGVIARRAGNIIYLADATLSVEDACSGIRSLFGITATATAFAFIAPGGALRKTILIVSAVPIAIFSNILRVTGTGLLYQYVGGEFAEGFYHSLEGWVFYVIALGLLFGEFFLLNAVFPPVSGAEEDAARKTERKAGKGAAR
jgi:exosortase